MRCVAHSGLAACREGRACCRSRTAAVGAGRRAQTARTHSVRARWTSSTSSRCETLQFLQPQALTRRRLGPARRASAAHVVAWTTQGPVGKLSRVRVGHDGSGFSPSWSPSPPRSQHCIDLGGHTHAARRCAGTESVYDAVAAGLWRLCPSKARAGRLCISRHACGLPRVAPTQRHGTPHQLITILFSSPTHLLQPPCQCCRPQNPFMKAIQRANHTAAQRSTRPAKRCVRVCVGAACTRSLPAARWRGSRR